MELEKAKVIADTVVKALEPYCGRVVVAGSIRRQKPTVRDIDLVLVARDRQNLDSALMRMGNYKMPGIARNLSMRLWGCLTNVQRKGDS